MQLEEFHGQKTSKLTLDLRHGAARCQHEVIEERDLDRMHALNLPPSAQAVERHRVIFLVSFIGVRTEDDVLIWMHGRS